MSDPNTRLGLALYAAIVGVFFFYGARLAFTEQTIAKRLKRLGITTNADVIEKKAEGMRSIRYCVTYRFHTSAQGFTGQVFTHTQSISEKHFRSLQSQPQVTISYLLENPHISRLTGTDQDNTRRNSGIFYMFLVVLAWAGTLYIASIL
ncbi:MAG: hypothetical protein IT324_30140 [Anaerolineae bacterium]|nr:hypothetical protein [Anaerolineae bacterium]